MDLVIRLRRVERRGFRHSVRRTGRGCATRLKGRFGSRAVQPAGINAFADTRPDPCPDACSDARAGARADAKPEGSLARD